MFQVRFGTSTRRLQLPSDRHSGTRNGSTTPLRGRYELRTLSPRKLRPWLRTRPLAVRWRRKPQRLGTSGAIITASSADHRYGADDYRFHAISSTHSRNTQQSWNGPWSLILHADRSTVLAAGETSVQTADVHSTSAEASSSSFSSGAVDFRIRCTQEDG